MAVSESDILKIASLARLRIEAGQVATLTDQLNNILGHMNVLSRVETGDVVPTAGIGADGMPLRADVVAPGPMQSTAAALTAESRDGFILVPRLSTHGDV